MDILWLMMNVIFCRHFAASSGFVFGSILNHLLIMHQLFVEVLTKRDLSRAGDLFSIEDRSIVTDLSILINEIQRISSSRDFNKINNDQSVIEICLTRITSAIR